MRVIRPELLKSLRSSGVVRTEMSLDRNESTHILSQVLIYFLIANAVLLDPT